MQPSQDTEGRVYMNRIANAFHKKAFIPFITCGDPSLEITEQAVLTMASAGASMIELGIPFSDPTAEGPIIQASSLHALQQGVTTDLIFDMVRRLRTKIDIPLLFMTYANVLFSYGSERFLRTCQEIGIDGIILPDIPYEEKDEFDSLCKTYDVALISLIAPTSASRIQQIAQDATGFVYCVSSLGVTGMRSEITTDIGAMVQAVKQAKDIPCAIGFGISTPEQASYMASLSDGVIVGSAIMKICQQHKEGCIPVLENYVKSMVAAIENF